MTQARLKAHLLTWFFLSTWAWQHAHAQSIGAADVLRSIEQNKQLQHYGMAPKAPSKNLPPPEWAQFTIDRLTEVEVHSPLFSHELADHWLGDINRPVSAQRISEFRAYAWSLFQDKGYLAYITTHPKKTAQGTALVVNISIPTTNKVIVVAENANLKTYATEVAKRFGKAFPKGSQVDIQGFESQITAMTYDLPVNLDVNLKQVNDKDIDVVVTLRPVDFVPGKVLSGIVQMNNYGLNQFSRNQALIDMRVAGLTPLSEVNLTSQLSEHVGYYRVAYEAPIESTRTRWKAYTSQVQSIASNNTGMSNEWGVGLTHLLSSDRSTNWYVGAEASHSDLINSSLEVETSHRVDNQVRWKLRTESFHGHVQSYQNEFLLTTGRMILNKNASDYSNDQGASGLGVDGSYRKLEMRGGLSNPLVPQSRWNGSIRWRTQVASKNLDTGNKIALGGINGIRTLSAIDGVGDQGAQLSFDLIHQTHAALYSGVFFDIGAVKNNHTDIQGIDSTVYTLKGMGYQLGGSWNQINWLMSVGRSRGATPSTWTAANTPVGTSKVNFAATYSF